MVLVWPRVMSSVFTVFAAYVTYLYLTGKLRLGPGGQEWDGVVSSKTETSNCPPPDCDCQMLRGRIAFLERKLHDTENSLLKAEGLYSTLYNKYLALLKERDEWKARAEAAEASVDDLKARLAAALQELANCRAQLQTLQAQCLERDLQVNACSPGLSQAGSLLR